MFAFDPSESVFHRLDPRAKLFVQLAFAVAAYARTDPASLLVLTGGVVVILTLANINVVEMLYRLRYILLLLSLPPVIAVIQLGPPWIDLADGTEPVLTGYRVLLILLVGLVYVRTTPIRASQAGIAWFIPGRVGRFLGIGVGLVTRLFPQIRSDIASIRRAMRIRYAHARPVHERIRLLVIIVIETALTRSRRMEDALRARCLSWNPTPYPLSATPVDGVTVAVGIGLLVWGLT